MSERAFTRARHRTVAAALARLDADFLERARCYFGGGTRIVLELDEYRESADIDFLCSDREGYRTLRSAISAQSLGSLATAPLDLMREIRADQYGLRTVLRIDDTPVKFEIINEARLELSGVRIDRLHVPCLDRACCFAEKILANDDRGMDESVSSRDVIDIAFMIEAWGMEPIFEGMRKAREAYGNGVDASLSAATQRLLDESAHFRTCVASLGISDTARLAAGLRKIAARKR